METRNTDSAIISFDPLKAFIEHGKPIDTNINEPAQILPPKKIKHSKKRKQSRVQVTLRAEHKQRVKVIADSRCVPFATFCSNAIMEYVEVIEKST
jgi:hypothetical protein